MWTIGALEDRQFHIVNPMGAPCLKVEVDSLVISSNLSVKFGPHANVITSLSQFKQPCPNLLLGACEIFTEVLKYQCYFLFILHLHS